MDSRLWPCPTCDDVRTFVQPPCADGHVDDVGECPEWACAECGTAFVTAEAGAAADSPRVRVAA